MSNPFVSVNRDGTVRKPIIVTSRRKTVAKDMSCGRDVHIEEIEYIPETAPLENWFESDFDRKAIRDPNDPNYDVNNDPSTGSGFGLWANDNRATLNQNPYPIESHLKQADIARIKMVDDMSDAAAKRKNRMSTVPKTIFRDPLTNIPSNVAEIDRTPGSTSFFGNTENHNEMEEVDERRDKVDRVVEHVDYTKGRAIPIKFMSKPR